MDDLNYLENPISYDSVIGDKIYGYEVYQELDKSDVYFMMILLLCFYINIELEELQKMVKKE